MEKENNSKRPFGIPIAFAIVIFIIGIANQIMHYPYSSELKLTGLIAAAFFIIAGFLKSKTKNLNSILQLILILSAIGILIMRIFGYFYFTPLIAIACIAGLIRLMNMKSSTASPTSKIASFSYKIAALAIIGGALFKIMHYPGSFILLMIGGLSAFIWFITDIVLKKS